MIRYDGPHPAAVLPAGRDAALPLPHPPRPGGAPPDLPAARTAEYVRRATRGDAAALEWLLGHFRPLALRAALRLVGDPADAEDVCQDALLLVVERIAGCRHPERFAAWLLRIVRNRGISLLRRRRVRAAAPLDAAAEVPGDGDPERDLERAELRGRVSEALDGLTRLQREVVVLYDLHGWRHAEVARRLGISEGSARVHLHNARRALRARLGPDRRLERAA